MELITSRNLIDEVIDYTKVATSSGEVILTADEHGIEVGAVSPSNVTLHRSQLSPKAFESYECPEPFNLGIRTPVLSDMISVGGGDDLVHLGYEPDSDGRIDIEVGHSTYKLSGLDPDTVTTPPDELPDIPYESNFVVENSKLATAVKSAKVVTDRLDLGFDPNSDEDPDGALFVDATGDTDQGRTEIPARDLIAVDDDSESTSTYATAWLSDMTGAIASDAEVRGMMATDFPVKFDFEYAGGNAEATFLIAPRIQSE